MNNSRKKLTQQNSDSQYLLLHEFHETGKYGSLARQPSVVVSFAESSDVLLSRSNNVKVFYLNRL